MIIQNTSKSSTPHSTYILFQGEEKISEVTGKPEPHYPAWKRNVFRFTVIDTFVEDIFGIFNDLLSDIL